MKAYLVWNPAAGDGEGVVFTDKLDAKYASTGNRQVGSFGVSSLADEFREMYTYDEPRKVFPIIEIDVYDQPKDNKVNPA